MAKIFGVLLIVLGVWVGMEIYTKGTDGAFGGIFAGWSQPIESKGKTTYEKDPTGGAATSSTGERGSLAQRVGTKVQSDLDAGAERDDADADDNN